MKNIFIFIVLSILLICPVIASFSNSTDYDMSSYTGFGVNSNDISYGNSSSGYGQIAIGNSSGTFDLLQGIFYMANTSAYVSTLNISCNSTNLNYCNTSSSCSGAGGYWWDGSCHVNPQSSSGGGGSGPEVITLRYLIYPKTIYDNINQDSFKMQSFYIENNEYSSPLSITITTDFDVYNKQFDVAPGRIAMINFHLNGSNKTGYYNSTINVKIMKNPTTYKYENIVVNYYVQKTKIIELNQSVSNVSQNKTIADVIPEINDEIKETASAAKTLVEKIISNPLFLIIITCILAILIIVMIQMSSGSFYLEDNVPQTPIQWIMTVLFLGAIGFGMWWFSTRQILISTIMSWYNSPIFIVIAISILVVLTIVMFQLRKDGDKNFSIGKTITFFLLIGLFLIILKNAGTFSPTFFSYLSHPAFLIPATCLLIILCIVFYQLSKGESEHKFFEMPQNPIIYILLLAIFGFIVFGIYWASRRKNIFSLIKSWYTEPVFLIVIFSLLILVTVIMLQLRKDHKDGFSWSKFVVLAGVIGLSILIFKNSAIMSKIYYNFPSLQNSIWFYIVLLSVLVIFVIVFLQLKKRNVNPFEE